MLKTRTISDIESGTVIDHIKPGCGLYIAQSLRLIHDATRMILCLNLSSNTLGEKDLIKISNIKLSDETLDKIAVFSPGATVSWIEDYQVERKQSVRMPERIDSFFSCPNDNCISREEGETSSFKLQPYKKQHLIQCCYCARSFDLETFKKRGAPCP